MRLVFTIFLFLFSKNIFAQVSGKVWLDKDNDGILDVAETTGISTVTVKGFWDDCAGNTGVVNTTSDATGNYILAGIPNGAKVRVEFSTIPSTYSPSLAGSSNGTITQIVTAPNAATHFGLKSNCTPIASNQIMQPGYSILTCLPGADNVVLAIKDIRQMGNLWDTPTNRNVDLSDYVPVTNMWTLSQFGGNKLFGLALNQTDGTIYVGTSEIVGDAQHYGGQVLSNSIPSQIYKIGPVSTTPVLLTTLPGNLGVGGIEFDPVNNQLFAVSIDNGMIYRINASTGAIVQTYDPLAADNATATQLPPVGDAIWALGYNQVEKKLYYSVIENHLASAVSYQALNGNFNKIRSVQIDASGAIVTASDALEITIPHVVNSVLLGYSAPVADIEFNAAGTKVLLAESGFYISVGTGLYYTAAHEERLLEYQKTGSTWNLEPIWGTNLNSKYDIGSQISYRGLNARGGAAWAYHDVTNNVVNGDEEFVLATADAIHLPADGDSDWVYGFQMTPSSGGNKTNSAIVNLGSQTGTKYTFSDVEIYKGNQCANNIEIGNYVWLDTNKNGVQDACENPLSNVKIDLKQSGTIVATTTTDSNGKYLFGGSNNTGFSFENTTTSSQNINYQMTKTLNDARENTVPNVFAGAGGLLFNNRYLGLRFPFLNIPKGATITSASLRFTSNSASGDINNVSIKGHKNVNSTLFTLGSGTDISTRYNTEGTTASVNWTNAAAWALNDSGANQTTPDLTAIVQEIVNLSSWERNKTLTFLVNAPINANGATAFDVSGDQTKGVILNINFTGTTQTTGSALQTNSSYTICVPLSQTPITATNLTITQASSTSNNGNDLNDNDGTIVGSNAVFAITTPNEGANHTQDFGFTSSCNLNFTLAQTNVTCNGAANGTITISTTSGTAPYEYSIDDGITYDAPTSSTTKSYNNLLPNSYKPAVKDSNGCIKKCN